MSQQTFEENFYANKELYRFLYKNSEEQKQLLNTRNFIIT